MALGDIVRNFLKSNLNDQLSELEKRTNLQITKMRSGGGSGDIEDTEKLREANIIGSSLNPAAAAMSIVQEKLMVKLKGEIEDLGSAGDLIKPALSKLDRSLTNMRKKLKQSIKDKKQADAVKGERNKMLGREE